MGTEKRNHPSALAVRWLLAWFGGGRTLLAARSGISLSTIRRYEKGETTPRRLELEALAEGGGLPVPVDELLSWCQRMVQGQPAPAADAFRGETRQSDLETAVEKLVQSIVSRNLLSDRSSPISEADAAERAQRLLGASPEERRWLLDETLEFRSWAVVEEIRRESRRLAADDPKQALELEELARALAELTPGASAESLSS